MAYRGEGFTTQGFIDALQHITEKKMTDCKESLQQLIAEKTGENPD